MARKNAKNSAPSSPEAGSGLAPVVVATAAAGENAAAEQQNKAVQAKAPEDTGASAPESSQSAGPTKEDDKAEDTTAPVATPEKDEEQAKVDKPEEPVAPVVAAKAANTDAEFPQKWRIENNSPSRLAICGFAVNPHSAADVEIKNERKLKSVASVIAQLNKMTLAGMDMHRYSFSKVK